MQPLPLCKPYRRRPSCWRMAVAQSLRTLPGSARGPAAYSYAPWPAASCWGSGCSCGPQLSGPVDWQRLAASPGGSAAQHLPCTLQLPSQQGPRACGAATQAGSAGALCLHLQWQPCHVPGTRPAGQREPQSDKAQLLEPREGRDGLGDLPQQTRQPVPVALHNWSTPAGSARWDWLYSLGNSFTGCLATFPVHGGASLVSLDSAGVASQQRFMAA